MEVEVGRELTVESFQEVVTQSKAAWKAVELFIKTVMQEKGKIERQKEEQNRQQQQ